jgi:hypothetical protein
MGNAIVLSTCNKPFKPLGIPGGRVKSCEGLIEMLPTNNIYIYIYIYIHIIPKNESSSKQWFLIHKQA